MFQGDASTNSFVYAKILFVCNILELIIVLHIIKSVEQKHFACMNAVYS
jgi:hypothetical protein